ncbi:MAG: Asp23/Gls24 family envelope stress response protein [Hydrogenibacillus sp.]|nr:Asp23/Gls24 family envelope stress response protein [Hydrogenibacillus sp.]
MWRMQTGLGTVFVSPDVIARIAGTEAQEVFGIIGMAARAPWIEGVGEWLGREPTKRGIEVWIEEGNIDLTIYVVVRYGTKISEVARNVQERVHYAIARSVGVAPRKIDVYVNGVRL